MTTETTEPTTHQGILSWVNEIAELTQPDRIHWCTGSDEEWKELTDALVAAGWPIGGRSRWRLGEFTVPWEAVAPR